MSPIDQRDSLEETANVIPPAPSAAPIASNGNVRFMMIPTAIGNWTEWSAHLPPTRFR